MPSLLPTFRAAPNGHNRAAVVPSRHSCQVKTALSRERIYVAIQCGRVAFEIEFHWDQENKKHLAAHKVAPADVVEQVLSNDPIDLLSISSAAKNGIALGALRTAAACYQWCGPFGTVRCMAPLPPFRLAWPMEGFSGETQIMKKQSEKKTTRVAPASFTSEAEEAAWWFENRDQHGKQMAASVKSGEAQVLTKAKLQERIAASRKAAAPVVALRIPAADLALARKQAEQKGLPYQTYIKSLLHETLVEREKRKTGW